MLEPTLVEARYRASVLVAQLAVTFEKATDQATPARAGTPTDDPVGNVLTMLELPADAWWCDIVPTTLEELAETERRGLLQLLRPWYTLLREGRLRNELELRGRPRRQLRRTISISMHCLAARKAHGHRSLRFWAGLRARRAWLRLGHLGLAGELLGWQAHYNAACFYALLAAHTDPAAVVAEAAVNGSSWRHPIWRLKLFFIRGCNRDARGNALRQLTIAVQEGRPTLSPEWVEADPDLDSVRAGDPMEWKLIRERFPKPLQASAEKWPSPPRESLVGGGCRVPGRPARPWGDPGRRLRRWAAAALTLGPLLLMTLYAFEPLHEDLSAGEPWAPLLLAPLAVALWRFKRVSDEVWASNTQADERRKDEAASTAPRD
jgi:hypothetical protein